MAFAPTPIHIELTDDERSELERIARGQAWDVVHEEIWEKQRAGLAVTG
jgi:hypothetical protein